MAREISKTGTTGRHWLGAISTGRRPAVRLPCLHHGRTGDPLQMLVGMRRQALHHR